MFLSRSLTQSTLWACALTAVAATAVHADQSWNAGNDPAIFDASYVKLFDRLPLNAQLPDDKTPWSDDYWANQDGGLNRRWFQTYTDEKIQGFDYKPPSRAQALTMTPTELKRLSPAEKYDLFLGHYDYPTVKWIWKNVSKTDKHWEGICNGWSPASILYTEPAPVTLRNPDGIEVPFGSSDVKGMMSLYYSWGSKIKTRQLGRKCKFDLDGPIGGLFGSSPNCKDTDAGAFHIVLTNQIGLKQESFIAEIDRSKEVWNNPVYKYEGKVISVARPGSNSPRGTVQRVRVLMSMWVTQEIDPEWQPVNGTEDFASKEEKYDYWIDLDVLGNIVGGEWVSHARPDFLWMTTKIPFVGSFEALNRIYAPYVKSIAPGSETGTTTGSETGTTTGSETGTLLLPPSANTDERPEHPVILRGPTFE